MRMIHQLEFFVYMIPYMYTMKLTSLYTIPHFLCLFADNDYVLYCNYAFHYLLQIGYL